MHRLIFLILGLQLALFASDNDQALLEAARKGDLPAVKSLCEKGAAIEAKTTYGQTPLYLAAMNGHEDVVRFLIEKGAGTDIKDSFYKASVLGFVLERKHFGIAKLLIASGGNADEQLSDVVEAENPELVQAVLAKGKVTQAALDKSYEAALDQKQTAIGDLLKKAGAHAPAPPFAVDPKVLESYAGTYKTDQLPFEIKAFVKDGN